MAFEAGVVAYHMGKLDSAKDSFARAYQISGRAGKIRSYLVNLDKDRRELHRKLEALAKKWGQTKQFPPSTEPELQEASGVIEPAGASRWVRRDGYGDALYIYSQSYYEWLQPGTAVTFNVGFNFRGAVALNLQRRRMQSS